MELGKPLYILLAIPWTVVVLLFHWRQKNALDALSRSVHPRFIPSMTAYTGRGRLTLHTAVLALMGALLIVAAAGPRVDAEVEAKMRTNTILFVLDGSMSMYAADPAPIPGMKPKDRKEEATGIALALMDTFPAFKYGLVSFSGVAAFHSPPTIDRDAVRGYLRTFRLHMFQESGTDFSAALKAVLHLAERSKHAGCQAVLLSDGEAVNGKDFTAELRALQKRNIPVHCVGIGTAKGSGIYIYDPSDLLAWKEKPRVYLETTTKRCDEALREIAKATGGSYVVTEKKESIEKLYRAIRNHPGQVSFDKRQGKKDMSHWLLALFALCFLLDTLAFDGIRFWRDALRLFRSRDREGDA